MSSTDLDQIVFFSLFCLDLQLRIRTFWGSEIRTERDHPFKTSAFLKGGGVKNLPNLSTDSTKKLPTVGG